MQTATNKRDRRLDDYQSDHRFCGDCGRQRAFNNGQCVVCVARRNITPTALMAQALRRFDRDTSAASHRFCQMIEG